MLHKAAMSFTLKEMGTGSGVALLCAFTVVQISPAGQKDNTNVLSAPDLAAFQNLTGDKTLDLSLGECWRITRVHGSDKMM